MSSNLKAYENEIRAAERERIKKVLARIADLHAFAGQLLHDLMLKNGVDAAQSNDNAPSAKAKRKPVAVTTEQKSAFAAKLGPHPLKTADIARLMAVSSRFAGEALRQLVAEGKASRTTGGKFRTVEQLPLPAAADGAGE